MNMLYMLRVIVNNKSVRKHLWFLTLIVLIGIASFQTVGFVETMASALILFYATVLWFCIRRDLWKYYRDLFFTIIDQLNDLFDSLDKIADHKDTVNGLKEDLKKEQRKRDLIMLRIRNIQKELQNCDPAECGKLKDKLHRADLRWQRCNEEAHAIMSVLADAKATLKRAKQERRRIIRWSSNN